jgi:hypothetical protein
MSKRLSFSQQQQFHLLIDFRDDERSITVLPGGTGKFLLLDQGEVLGELDFDQHFNCISNTSGLSPAVHAQLSSGIKNHY